MLMLRRKQFVFPSADNVQAHLDAHLDARADRVEEQRIYLPTRAGRCIPDPTVAYALCRPLEEAGAEERAMLSSIFHAFKQKLSKCSQKLSVPPISLYFIIGR